MVVCGGVEEKQRSERGGFGNFDVIVVVKNTCGADGRANTAAIQRSMSGGKEITSFASSRGTRSEKEAELDIVSCMYYRYLAYPSY